MALHTCELMAAGRYNTTHLGGGFAAIRWMNNGVVPATSRKMLYDNAQLANLLLGRLLWSAAMRGTPRPRAAFSNTSCAT